MNIIFTAQDLLNTGIATYGAIALLLLALLALLCVGVAVIERLGTTKERRAARPRRTVRPASYGAVRRQVLGTR